MIGTIYEKKGRLGDAIAAYEKALASEQISHDEKVGLLIQLTKLADQRNDPHEAERYLRLAEQIDANAPPRESFSLVNWLKRLAERITGRANEVKDGLVVSTPVDITVQDGDIVVAAITSCTNTSNPALMIAAGLVAKKAHERGLKVNPRVKTSLAPGSRVASEYLEKSGLQRHLDALGFNVVGYGCTTCIGNSGPLAPELEDVITKNKIVTASVLSGNRNFEARIHAAVYANFLASPPLVVAYALAGRVTIDIDKDPVGHDTNGAPVFLRDIWPSAHEVNELLAMASSPESYQRLYGALDTASPKWTEVQSKTGLVYEWDPVSTYVREPPYFEHFGHAPSDHTLKDIGGARALAIFGDSITTDHISPAGAIKASSPAGVYLRDHGVAQADFNSYGSRRGNHEVMVRGTFANVRIKNQMVPGVEGGVTAMQPSGETLAIFDAAETYAAAGTKLFVFAGHEYGTGSSRDWAAKGPRLQNVSAVFARSFERIHRSNLVGMGVLPCQLPADVSAETLKLTGKETFDLLGIGNGVHPRMQATLRVHREDGSHLDVAVTVRIDTPIEVEYFKHGGILPFVLQQLLG
jgi:aconitate hydratase